MQDTNKLDSLITENQPSFDNDYKEAMKYGKYNTGYLLNPSQLHFGALLQISKQQKISLSQAAQNEYVSGFYEGDFKGLDLNKIDESFYASVTDAIEHCQVYNKPAYLSIEDGYHFITIALVPNPNNLGEMSMVYINSMDNNTGEVGKNVIKHVLEKNGYSVKEKNIITSQQYENCCGLSVATNIASLSTHFQKGGTVDDIESSLVELKTTSEKSNYYKDFGAELFASLGNNVNIETLEKKVDQLVKNSKRFAKVVNFLEKALEESDLPEQDKKEIKAQVLALQKEYEETWSKQSIGGKIIDILARIFGKDLYSRIVLDHIQSISNSLKEEPRQK